MALDIVEGQNTAKKAIIYTDNQAAIKTLANPQSKSAQYIVQQIVKQYNRLICPVEIHWIPAHAGVPGNEIADWLAKRATGWREDPQDPTTGQMAPAPQIPLRPLLAATRAAIRAKATKQWAQQWDNPQRGPGLHCLMRGPSKNSLTKHHNLQ